MFANAIRNRARGQILGINICLNEQDDGIQTRCSGNDGQLEVTGSLGS
jgi:hypothetical protein